MSSSLPARRDARKGSSPQRPHEALWECSSPDSTPTKAPAAGERSWTSRASATEGLNASEPPFTGPFPSRPAARVVPDDLPDIRDAEKQLDAGLSALHETLLQHDKEVMSREEALLALSREAKAWRKRMMTLEGTVESLRREKEDAAAKASREVESLCRLHRAEVEACQNARHSAEMQLQKLMIDYDEVKQQLTIAKRQVRDLETQKDEMNGAVAALQRRLQQREADSQNHAASSSHESQATRQKLESLRGKFDALERLCDSLRHEKDDMEKQARQSLLELHELRSKKDHRVLVDVNEVYQKEQQIMRFEEQLQAAHLGNARLLRLMAECQELHDVIRFNEITQDFVFVGYHGHVAPESMDPSAFAIPPGAEDDERRVRTACEDARRGKASTGGSFGVVVGANSNTKNAYLRGGVESPRRSPPFTGVPNAMRHLHDAIRDENRFLHRQNIQLSASQPPSPALGANANGMTLTPPSNNLIECKSHEKFYWIPRSALVEAQDFKEAYFPRLSLQVFFPFLVRLNQIWRHREQHLVREAKRTSRQLNTREEGPRRRSASAASGSRRTDYEHATTRKLEEDLIAKELEALRREVRLRVSSKTALQICKQLENVARHQIAKRAAVEVELEELAAIHQRMLADRAPETVAMQSHLRTMSDTARSLSHHIASKLGGSSSDMKRFVASLESAATRSSTMQNGVVSATVVKQLMECMKDFADEVKTEASVTTDSLRRIADAAERAATDVPPAGYNIPKPHASSGRHLRSSDNDDDDDREFIETSRIRPSGGASGSHKLGAFDDLVDDVFR